MLFELSQSFWFTSTICQHLVFICVLCYYILYFYILWSCSLYYNIIFFIIRFRFHHLLISFILCFCKTVYSELMEVTSRLSDYFAIAILFNSLHLAIILLFLVFFIFVSKQYVLLLMLNCKNYQQ